jgi:multimeric flavodoxin WrbA
MKVTILNGNPDPNNLTFDSYLVQLTQKLEESGSQVTRLTLRDLKLQYCSGCFGCWLKTPGECVANDDNPQMLRAIINADFMLWAAPMRMGFPSALLKKSMDKMVPLIHPYIVVDHGEAHHLARYNHYPRLGLLLEKEMGGDA